jgi:hypothetical protein
MIAQRRAVPVRRATRLDRPNHPSVTRHSNECSRSIERGTILANLVRRIVNDGAGSQGFPGRPPRYDRFTDHSESGTIPLRPIGKPHGAHGHSLPLFAAIRQAMTAFGENVPVFAKSVRPTRINTRLATAQVVLTNERSKPTICSPCDDPAAARSNEPPAPNNECEALTFSEHP